MLQSPQFYVGSMHRIMISKTGKKLIVRDIYWNILHGQAQQKLFYWKADYGSLIATIFYNIFTADIPQARWPHLTLFAEDNRCFLFLAKFHHSSQSRSERHKLLFKWYGSLGKKCRQNSGYIFHPKKKPFQMLALIGELRLHI